MLIILRKKNFMEEIPLTIKSKVIKLTTAASFAVAGIATLSAAKLNSLSLTVLHKLQLSKLLQSKLVL